MCLGAQLCHPTVEASGFLNPNAGAPAPRAIARPCARPSQAPRRRPRPRVLLGTDVRSFCHGLWVGNLQFLTIYLM